MNCDDLALGAVLGDFGSPVLFGDLLETASRSNVFIGSIIGTALMIGNGILV